MRGFTRTTSLCLLALVYARAVSAQAEPEKAPQDIDAVIASTEYKELVREGMLKYTRGFWPEARAYFLKAHELAPNARTLRGLALVSYDSRHFVDAVDYGEQALAHKAQPLNEKMVEEIKQLIAQSQGMVTRAELVTTPAAAELRVDGALVARRPDGTVWLDAGEHELSVSAPGYRSESRHLHAAAEQPLREEITLRSTSPAPTQLAHKPVQTPAPERSALPWVVVGVSGALAAGGGAMLALDQSDGQASAFTPLGGALLGVGAVGLIVGITWSLWPQSEERPASARLQLAPLSAKLDVAF